MTMEVLSRHQFEVLGSAKVQEWTSSVPTKRRQQAATSHGAVNNTTGPSSPASSPQRHQQQRHQQQQQQQQEQQQQQQQYDHQQQHHHHHHHHHSNSDERTAHALALRLQAELRAAKSQHLACAEVLLPADLLGHVAGEMMAASELEPCGIRGCQVFVEFEDEPGSRRRIAAMQVDAGTVSTFELYLTLKHDRSGWTSMLPQFLKNFTRSSTIMISPDYTLTKHKLYNSFTE